MAELGERVRASGNPRGEDTRRRILRAALELFGSQGFEGASTRALADRAEVNLPAIQYYFGSKEGLYRAVIQQITERVAERAAAVTERIALALKGEAPSRQALLGLLGELTDVLVALILDETLGDRDTCRRFFARLEIEQNPAISLLHECFGQYVFEPGAALIGRLLGRPPQDELVRMRMIALVGQAKAFGCWGSDQVLGWQHADPERVRAVQTLLRDHVAAVFQAAQTERG